MGLSHSVEGARHFTEETLHWLTALPGSYAARLRSGREALGNRIASAGLSFLAAVASPASVIAAPFNSVPESLGSRNAIVLPLKSTISTDSKIRVTGNLGTGFTATVDKQANPPQEPEEGEEPKDTTDTGANDKPLNIEVLPPTQEVGVNPENELDKLGPNQAAVLGLIESNASANAAGGESTEAQLNLPYLRRFANKEGGKVWFNNPGNQVGLTIGDPELLEQTITFLADKYRPNGVEFFFPSLEDFVKLQRGTDRIQDRLTNLRDEDMFFSSFRGAFLKNTAMIIGQRKDGVTEIYLGLSLIPGANPTAEDIREHGFMLTDTLGRQMVGGYSEKTKDDLSELRSKLIDRRNDEPKKPFPLMPAIAPS